MTTRTRQIALGIALATIAASSAHAAGPRPLFQMPEPCGQLWEASTYNNHWPDQDSIDLAKRNQSNTNISEGEPVIASAAGTVDQVFTTNGGEHRVYLDHGDGWKTHYIHIEDKPPLTVGQKVAQGEVIGRTSNSGAVAVHLHYTQLRDGSAVRAAFDGSLIDTHAGNLDSYGTWGGDAEELVSRNCAGNTFMGYTHNGQNYQLTYKAATGQVSIVRANGNGIGVTNTWNGQWSRGWTHHASYYLNTQYHAFVYKASTGRVSFLRMNLNGNGVTNLGSRNWYAGWTHFTPFRMNGKTYFVAYDSLNGYANIDRVNASGSSTTTLYSTTWLKGRTSIVPFKLGSAQYLLLYKGGDGGAKIFRVTANGNSISLNNVWSGNWSTGWTTLVPFSHRGGRYLLGYKAETGKAKILRLKSGGQGVYTTASMNWSKGWSALSPMLINGRGHILAYKIGSGLVKMLKVRYHANGIDTIWSTHWTTGWT